MVTHASQAPDRHCWPEGHCVSIEQGPQRPPRQIWPCAHCGLLLQLRHMRPMQARPPEHCSLEASGFMEGGCESGERAANAIARSLGVTPLSARYSREVVGRAP